MEDEEEGEGHPCATSSELLASYPRNLVPGGPSCRILLTRLSPSLRGGGALGRCSLLSHDRESVRVQQ